MKAYGRLSGVAGSGGVSMGMRDGLRPYNGDAGSDPVWYEGRLSRFDDPASDEESVLDRERVAEDCRRR